MFIPLESYGVKVVSMEMFKPERSDAIAYRGPLLHRVLEQLLSDAYWGDLDLLFIDLPPGTGDLAISLGQLQRHKLQLLKLQNVQDVLLIKSTKEFLGLSKICQRTHVKNVASPHRFLVKEVELKPHFAFLN
jgi:Mrp family chromosome partitioning ATPase